MGAAREMVEEVTHVFVQKRILVQECGKEPALLLIGQRSVNQQVGDFHECLRFDEFLNRNAAVSENAFFTVDECDTAVADRCIGKALVQRNISGLFPELGNVKRFFPLGSNDHRQFDFLAADLQYGKFGFRIHFHLCSPKYTVMKAL